MSYQVSCWSSKTRSLLRILAGFMSVALLSFCLVSTIPSADDWRPPSFAWLSACSHEATQRFNMYVRYKAHTSSEVGVRNGFIQFLGVPGS